MFIDVHSHLDLFENIPEVISNAKKQNVKIVSAAVNEESNKKLVKLKEQFPQIEICLGLYPTEVLKLSKKEIDSEIDFIKNNKDKIVGIGEIGLDLKENSPETLEEQKESFSKFVNLAKEINKPIVVHSRKAEEECINLLEELNYKKIVIHCFSGNFKLIKKIIENNWMMSIPTSVKNSQHFQKIIEFAPIENLLCETDSPYLHPDKKFPNEPKNVIESYKKISEIKNIPLEKVEKIIERNYANFFK